jgi:hypothetical protein
MNFSLSGKVLPLRALTLISEYSKPITREDWKTFKKMTQINFNDELKYSKINKVLDLLCNTYWLSGLTYTNLYPINTSICIISLSFTIKIEQVFSRKNIYYQDEYFTVIKIDGNSAEVKDDKGNIIKSIIDIRYNKYHKHYNEELIIATVYYHYTLTLDNLIN